MKVAVAMSGGVDSSVAAALCVEKYGKENVFGVTMRLFCYGEAESDDKSCCSLDAVNDAKQVCDQLGIAHYAISFEKEFETAVINDFVDEYQKGNTPNPCVRCNQIIKFENLLDKAKALGADTLVTGHYARVLPPCHPKELSGAQRREDLDCHVVNTELTPRNDDHFYLLKGKDKTKDQSYFLYNLNQEQLAHVDFPIGALKKTETRKIAAELGLKTAEKTESQDICFVSTSLRDFLKPRVKFAEGDIVTRDSQIIGKHEGLPFYTIGQRKGLGGGFAEPMYVIGVNVDNNELIVGREEYLFSSSLTVLIPHWISGQEPKMPFGCKAKIRYLAEEAECTIKSLRGVEGDEAISVTFREPQKAITSGQSCVFYKDEEVLGGGIIIKA